MQQSKLESAIEASINTFSGMFIAFSITILFNYVDFGYIYLGDGLTPLEAVYWTIIMTVVSVARSYFWRRMFARGIHLIVHKMILNKIVEDTYDKAPVKSRKRRTRKNSKKETSRGMAGSKSSNRKRSRKTRKE